MLEISLVLVLREWGVVSVFRIGTEISEEPQQGRSGRQNLCWRMGLCVSTLTLGCRGARVKVQLLRVKICT